MFKRLLIANRGEIALRVLRTCKRMNIETVCVYSTADRDALYLRLADRRICIGPPASSESYLNINQILAAAEISDADSIHPGYGFLSENKRFADIVETCGIAFVGPSPDAIELCGDKSRTRDAAAAAGIPTVPGSEGVITSDEEALSVADRIGYPVLIKASAGGGGRGMRIAGNRASLIDRMSQARAEAKVAFGNDEVYIEKLIEQPRHIEVQILGDKHGNVVHLGERDCTVQRRHQKLMEETPSPVVDATLREKLGAAAIALAKEIKYYNAGTVEFIVDKHKNFYFIELNSRLQVEHPVTEMVTGLDLVEQQIRVACGEPLAFQQKDIVLNGASMECRINAEDPAANFSPRPGRIELYSPPQGKGVRMDSHIYTGYSIPPYYDSMLGKLIVHAPDRDAVIDSMKRALDNLILEGPPTTARFLRAILDHNRFVTGDYHTKWIDEEFMKK
ncbi:MAG: acetyl-CoA carboxylase biotin carboxylase subunit [Planctomycetota bacterium]